MSRYRNFIFIILLNVLLISLLAFDTIDASGATDILRVAVALIYLVFVPGYVLQEALLPDRNHLALIDRIAISIGLSIAILPIMGLILDGPFGGIRLWQSVVFLTLFTLTFMLIAVYRQRNIVQQGEATATFGTWWQSLSSQSQIISALFVLVILVSSFIAVANFLARKPAQNFTEFYLVGPEQIALDYPYSVTKGQPFKLSVGVANHEGKDFTYSIEARMNGQILAGTAPFTLADGQSISLDMALTSSVAGNQQALEVLLLQNGEIYRRLYLWLNVESP